MDNLKRKISFLDAENHRADIEVEITNRNGYPEFTASGNYLGCGGQCLDKIKPRTHEQKLLIGLWQDYHLKDISKLPAHISFVPNFAGHLTGILDEIEKQEKERQTEQDEANKDKTEDEKLLEQMENYGIDEDDLNACRAYLEARIADDLKNFSEAYQGEHNNDEDFVKQLLEDTEGLLKNLPPYIHINWEATTRDIMIDYTEQDGHYFRNL